jgi:hypothetical protein
MRIVYAALITLFAVPHAEAQNTIITLNSDRGNSTCPCQTISANFQLSQPAPSGASSSDLTNLLAGASKSLYDIVDKQ